MSGLLDARADNDEMEIIKSAVREKWCRQNGDNWVEVHYELNKAQLFLMQNDGVIPVALRTGFLSLELDCWKEALVWIDKKEKEDAQ